MLKIRLTALLLGLCGAAFANAATFPQQAVTIVVPFTAGGATDGLARELANHMSGTLGQPVIVENKPGAGTTIASAAVKNAKPDGHTLLLAASSFGIAPSLYKNPGYDPLQDFTPVSQLASITHVLAVSNTVPATDVQSFIEWVRQNPGKVNYASVGAGTTTHLEAELFKSMADIDMTHVPYKGSQPALVDLVSGRVQAMFDAYTSSAPLAADGRIKLLGVTTSERSKVAPDVPTIAESGVPGFDVMTWMGLLAPAGTPPEAVAKIHQAVATALNDEAVAKNLSRLGFSPIGSSPQAFAEYLERDVNQWSRLVRDQNISLD